MNKQNLFFLAATLIALISTGCSNSASTNLNNTISQATGLAFTPSVYIECDADVNSTCKSSSESIRCNGSLSSRNAYAVITKNSCSNLATDYLAKGTDTIICNEWGCSGNILRLTNSSNQIIDQMPAGNANLCVYIDINCDGTLSIQDLFQQKAINVHDDLAEVEILNWIQL